MVFFSSSVLLALSSGMSVELNSTLSALFIFTFLFLVGNCNLNFECNFVATAVLGVLMKEFRGPQSFSVWVEIGKPAEKNYNELTLSFRTHITLGEMHIALPVNQEPNTIN